MFARLDLKTDALERFDFLSGIAQANVLERNIALGSLKNMGARILLLLHVEELEDALSRHADARKC